ncbi:MAG: S-methyl-5-thioribose-1-phosphate isomerase [Chlorobi bacterium]|nr:S-methyl-5-thioribose-1-phosphate isomerase [Chlorobiota bacterium]
MIVNGKHYKTVWYSSEDNLVYMIDQVKLPFKFEIISFKNYVETAEAIRTMIVRGAGAIGAAAGFAMAQAFVENRDEDFVNKAKEYISSTRPTAVNLFYAVEKVYAAGMVSTLEAVNAAVEVAEEDEENCRRIGEYGNSLIGENYRILTHCNAGWLAFVDYGTALAPVYVANENGKNPFVFVDETRPRGQGARLTAWELNQSSINHRVIADNAAAFYMSGGRIDMVIVGADRIAANGDVANKIGTLEKAIAANYYGIPFYVAAPSSTFDRNCTSGKEIIIEERDERELLYHTGPDRTGQMVEIQLASPGSHGLNPAFDVTPAELITGIITEKGIFKPNQLLDNLK